MGERMAFHEPVDRADAICRLYREVAFAYNLGNKGFFAHSANSCGVVECNIYSSFLFVNLNL